MNGYLKQVKDWWILAMRGIPHAGEIIQGMVNDVKLEHGSLPENKQLEIIKRRMMCEDCPFNNINAKTSPEYYELYGKHYESDRTESHCSHCGCPIKIRTAALDANCGIEYYNQQPTTTKKLELKWKKYEES